MKIFAVESGRGEVAQSTGDGRESGREAKKGKRRGVYEVGK